MERMMRKCLLLGALVAMSSGLVGCGGSSAFKSPRSNFVEFTHEQRMEIEASAIREYRIQQDDILRIDVSNLRELSQSAVLVLPDGAISLVGVDRIQVGGLTLTEADSAITAAYSREYRDPRISVIVLETKGRQIYVLGEVRSPGLQRLSHGGLSVVGAVTLAGGFTEDAAPDGTVLVRITPEGYLAQELDLSSFHDVGSMALASVELLPFDVLYVPRSRMGDFAYFSKTILAGLANITRMASDIKFLSSGKTGRF
jgi:protein involved in polysaccharide export with SLBB domain